MSIIIGESHVESVFIANIEPAEDPSIDWERVTEHIFAEKMFDVWFKDKMLFTESNDGKRTLIHQIFRPLFIHFIGALKFYKLKSLSDSKDDINVSESEIQWNNHPDYFVFKQQSCR